MLLLLLLVELTEKGMDCRVLWPLFEFQTWSGGAAALPGYAAISPVFGSYSVCCRNAMVAQRQYCVKGTW